LRFVFEGPARPELMLERAEMRSAAPFKVFIRTKGRQAGPVMRNLVLYVLLLFMFAASVASATTFFTRSSPTGDDFCFGYAICE
jgi:hypothetical protein